MHPDHNSRRLSFSASGRRALKRRSAALAIVYLAAFVVTATELGVLGSGSPSGAIFTTTPAGNIVNENVHYADKRDVYLDGGPPPNAPATSAGLDDGLYVFQVTDPSGSFQLSEDASKCRIVRVAGGLIVERVAPSSLGLGLTDVYGNGNNPKPCSIDDNPQHPTNPGVRGDSGRHDTNVDADHGLPAIVVQLMPYGTTPNPGGVYKAWITPLAAYQSHGGDLSTVPSKLSVGKQKPHKCPDFCAAADPGFGPPRGEVKTDNYKVIGKGAPPPPSAMLHVRKFNDRNGDGLRQEATEPLIVGWGITITDPTAVVNSYFTPVDVVAEPPGNYHVDEDNPAGWVHTVTIVNGTSLGAVDPATVNVASGSDNTVIFGNFRPGRVSACKFYDFNRDGSKAGTEEVDLSGWPMTLSGITFEGVAVGPITQATGSDGCTGFPNLIEGSYTVTEGTPSETNWSHTTPDSVTVTLEPGETETASFGNVCLVPFAGGLTMGYWKTHTGLDSPDRDPTYDQLPIVLGIAANGLTGPEQQIDDEAEAIAVFDAAEASSDDGVNMLKGQLLAAKLNALKLAGFEGGEFPDGTVVGDVIQQADQILDDLSNGIAHTKAEIIAVKDLLDAANNNGHTGVLVAPPTTPCPHTFP